MSLLNESLGEPLENASRLGDDLAHASLGSLAQGEEGEKPSVLPRTLLQVSVPPPCPFSEDELGDDGAVWCSMCEKWELVCMHSSVIDVKPGDPVRIRDASNQWHDAIADSGIEGTHHGGGRKVHDFPVVWIIHPTTGRRVPWPMEDVRNA